MCPISVRHLHTSFRPRCRQVCFSDFFSQLSFSPLRLIIKNNTHRHIFFILSNNKKLVIAAFDSVLLHHQSCLCYYIALWWPRHRHLTHNAHSIVWFFKFCVIIILQCVFIKYNTVECYFYYEKLLILCVFFGVGLEQISSISVHFNGERWFEV